MTKSIQARLLRAARAAAKNAHAPFSKLNVGAAVLTSGGCIFPGCNVENSSYGLTICAERVAIFKAVSAGERHLKAVAVFAPAPQSKIGNRKSKMPLLTPPCGSCLQVVNEFGDDDTEIVLSNGRSTRTYRLRQLLPLGFRL
jgi:cytidine deaminase